MEITDEGVLGLANVLAVKATGAEITGADVVLLGGILNSQERKKLLERAFSLRNKLDLLIKHLASSKTGGSLSRKRVGLESRTMEVDVPSSETPRRTEITAGSERQNKCCEHLCSSMNPALWSTLPTELLQIVFARLPFPEVYQDLRLLSKEWKWNATAGDSDLNRARAEVNPKICAILFDDVWEIDDARFSESYMYDVTWRLFPRQGYGKVKCASGGLVCCVSSSKVLTKVVTHDGLVKKLATEESPLRISVCNPLTRESKGLPSHPLNFSRPPLMVQLVVNRDTKCYEVIVVGVMDGGIVGKWIAAMIYNSSTGAWRIVHHRGWQYENPLTSRISGRELQWDDEKAVLGSDWRSLRLCAFDFAKHEFVRLGTSAPDNTATVHGSTLEGDHIFVLHKEPCGEYFISEYQGQKCEPTWVQIRSYKCHNFGNDLVEIYKLRLDACEGFLMVTATNSYGRNDHVLSSGYGHELVWLYDLGTGEWKPIKAPKDLVGDPGGIMCELRWDAVP